DRQQIQRVVRQFPPALSAELLCTLLPRIHQRDDVIYLNRTGSSAAAGEIDAFAGVRILEHPRDHGASVAAGAVGFVGQIPPQDVVAGVAAVVPAVDGDIVGPRLTELITAVTRL